MKVSIRKLFSFVLLLALLVFLFFFNRRRVILFFIIAMVMYLISAIVLFLPSFKLPEIVLEMFSGTQETGQNNTFICRLFYRDYYPFTKIKITYGIKHTMEEEYNRIESYYSVYHGEREYRLDLTFRYCGLYVIKCEEALIYDFLGLFSRKLKNIQPTQAVVLPQDVGIKFQTSKFVLDDEEDFYSDPNAGTDVSEIKELRDYREGDRLSQVHWKLSTKSEDLIVKEYAQNAGVCVVVACDGIYNTPNEITNYYELLYAFGRNLIQDETFFELVYFNSQEEDVVSIKIDNLYDLNLTIQNMYFFLQATDTSELEEYYNRNNSSMKLIYLTFNEFDTMKYRTLLVRNNAKIVVPIE